MSQQAAEQTTAYCLSHGLGVYLQDALQLYPTAQQPAHGTSASTQPHAQGSNSATATSNSHQPNLFLAHYLTSVVCCQHVLWRHFAFVSGTHHNRKAYLAAAQRSLLPLNAAGQLAFGDVHSLLQLLCPDFPASVVKNAWSSAVDIQEWVDYQRSKEQQQQQQQQQGASDQQGAAAELGAGGTPERVQLGVFWQCLEVTFFYEHCLLYIRREAFRKDKKCISMQQLESAMQQAGSILPQHGWPVPPERAWKQCVQQASRAATIPDFAFRDLVRALCCNKDMVKAVRMELQEAAASAATTAAALAYAASSRSSSNTGDAA